MIRRFLSGLSWGAAASVVGLSLISQIAMPTYRTNQAANDVVAPENSAVAEVPAADAAIADQDTSVAIADAEKAASDPESATETTVDPQTADPAGTKVALPEMPMTTTEETVETQVVPKVTDAVVGASTTKAAPKVVETATVPQPTVESSLPEIQKSTAPPVTQPIVPGADSAPQATVAKGISSADTGDAAPLVDGAPIPAVPVAPAVDPALPETTDVAIIVPATPAEVAKPAVQPEVLPVPEPAPPEPVPEVAGDVAVIEPPVKPAVLDTNTEVTLLPDTGLTEQVEGVVTGRLAVIEPKSTAPQTDSGEPVDPNLNTIPTVTLDDASPLVKYAQKFDGIQTNPLFAILLVDDGSADLDRAALANIPLPVSFVIDPLAANAKEAAAIYRGAGHEILMLASGIPQGATAGDVEQTFQAHAGVLPESVAVLDLSQDGFQDNRPLAAMVVPVLHTQGRGLITFDRGLNAADQVARREMVPAATIFRVLDGENESAALIRRYLDRAAFKAAQEGHVLVMGSARPETVSALLEWAVEGRSTTVTLVPATAVLGAN